MAAQQAHDLEVGGSSPSPATKFSHKPSGYPLKENQGIKCEKENMKTSSKGIDLIKKHERLELAAYKCPAGIPTIGYGHTKNVQLGMRTSIAGAEIMLKEDLSFAESAVNRLVMKPINQNQFDALVSLVFNIGETKFKDSTLLKVINRNPNDSAIKAQFERWIFGGGKVLPGLVTRRRDEATLYFSRL